MDEQLKKLLDELKSDPKATVAKLRVVSKDRSKIDAYIKEFRDQDRSQRPSQVDNLQKDKGKNKAVKIYMNHAQNIVETLAAFIVGKPVNLIPSEENKLHDLIKQMWRINRMDSKILKSMVVKMSQTQVAMHFYIKDIAPTSVLNKVLLTLGLKTQAREIKTKLLDNTKGKMTPYFNDYGDMLLFMWEYATTVDDKTVNHIQIWDEKTYHYLNDASGDMIYADTIKPHGFDRIPIAYDSQFEPEWYPVKHAADRHEVALSKLGDSTDYSGHPILVTIGKVTNMPTKNESGKHFNIPKKYDQQGKDITGEVKFLEANNAPELNKLEIEKLEDAIAYGSSVPNLSLDRLKGLGNVAEKTVKLMFLGTEIKAELRRTEVRTFIERCINIMMSGVVTTTNTSLKAEGEKLYYDIHFNSILPNDISERVNMAAKAVEAGLMSRKTGVGIIDLVDDVRDELETIDQELPIIQENLKNKKSNQADPDNDADDRNQRNETRDKSRYGR